MVELAAGSGGASASATSRLRDLAYAARVHDIGKVGVPDAVLFKPGPLDAAGGRAAARALRAGAPTWWTGSPASSVWREIVRHHHERFDGRGYPDGLEADESPFESRILAVADAYVAMNEDRPYRRRFPPTVWRASSRTAASASSTRSCSTRSRPSFPLQR